MNFELIPPLAAVAYVAWLAVGVVARRGRVAGPSAAAWTTAALFASLFANIAASAIEGRLRGEPPFAVAFSGTVLIGAKAAVTIWAVRSLGRHYSYNVCARRGHELVRSGPYALCRHPMYAARLLATAGTALSFGSYMSLAFFCSLDLVIIATRVRSEEKVLLDALGESYRKYAAEVGLVLPKLRIPDSWGWKP